MNFSGDLKKQKIGIIGIGLVGTAMSKNLIADGWKLMGFDIKKEQMRNFESMGGKTTKNPAMVAEESDIILLSLMNSDIVKEVVSGKQGILSAERKPTIIIDTTTGDPVKTEEISKLLAKEEISYMDATISGSSKAIEERNGIFMIGGKRKDFKSLQPLYETLCKNYIYVGKAGTGARAKLAVNLVMGLNRVALAEGLIFAEKMGLNPEKSVELFLNTYAYSKIMDLKAVRMIKNDFKAGGKLAQHLKDVKLILKYAKRKGQILPLSEIHRKILENGVKEGDGGLDNSALFKELRRNRLHITLETQEREKEKKENSP